jgi:hypothetical protein
VHPVPDPLNFFFIIIIILIQKLNYINGISCRKSYIRAVVYFKFNTASTGPMRTVLVVMHARISPDGCINMNSRYIRALRSGGAHNPYC